MKLSKRPMVAVRWDDAHAMATGEFTQEEVDATEAYQFTTYGLLARADDKIVAVASEEGEDGKLRGITFIPRQMVVEMVMLGQPKMKKTVKKTVKPKNEQLHDQLEPQRIEPQPSDPSEP